MTTTTTREEAAQQGAEQAKVDYDVVIVGAGFSGMYQLHKLRQQGMTAHVFETGDDVGGTWFWNRYPGARVDIESHHYSFGFDEQLQQEWDWQERYAPQPELLAYARHVSERYDLRKDISFSTKVEALDWDDASGTWTVRTDNGDPVTCRFVILATGCLSVPQRPKFEGLDDFKGELYYTSSYPKEGVDLSGKKVAVIGTGSSGLQTITAIAPEVGELTVYQRTPSFAVPARNYELSDEDRQKYKANYSEIRTKNFASKVGFDDGQKAGVLASELPPDEVRAMQDDRWEFGGLSYGFAFGDILLDAAVNEQFAEYVRERIRERVKDPELAEKLSPRTYPIASKRMCVDTGYFEVYNQDNVTLIDIHEKPIEKFTEGGIIAGGEEREYDVVILATGFDAMTGAVNKIDITARGKKLREHWAHGPQTYLGLMVSGFPNLLMITGPQSPSVLTNMMTSIEYDVDWISRLLTDMRDRGKTRIEARPESEQWWVKANNDIAALTLMPQAHSWYMGANIPGKEQVFMPWVGGSDVYMAICEGIALAGNYHGFKMQ
ncbi:flavin-containing monooxygenase [Cumulibacter manganitolerans]|uniref:flavin-containing monooxygenase n=1 Tax=Cumulibacter manganitolerans TaxID=1884992 RepID=UPI0012978A90|nr:NAD(P)/FAD-dependent oxidoreductase [Cumulibacter manganitolerans]